jgi:hypothetical protein
MLSTFELFASSDRRARFDSAPEASQYSCSVLLLRLHAALHGFASAESVLVISICASEQPFHCPIVVNRTTGHCCGRCC